MVQNLLILKHKWGKSVDTVISCQSTFQRNQQAFRITGKVSF